MSVLISTRGRAESLALTLRSLFEADRKGLEIQVIVINNTPPEEIDDTDLMVMEFRKKHEVLLLHEGTPGKCHALNRAIQDCRLGDLMVVIDDDISVSKDWFQNIAAISERWPDKGFFSGRTAIQWPACKIPNWALHPGLRWWAYSVVDISEEHEIGPDKWVSGNHYWVRTRFLPPDYRYNDAWLSGAKMMLDMAESGHGGLIAPAALAWHRIQPSLLRPEVIRHRADHGGRESAKALLLPYRPTIRQAVMFRKHPLFARAFCLLQTVRWMGVFAASYRIFSRDLRFVRQLEARLKIGFYTEMLKVASAVPEYRIISEL